MIRFILNQQEISTALPAGTLLLDFIRYHKHQKGTKIGCREGDCGACTVLIGEIKDNKLFYSGATSCLMALGNAAGKHIVTIEGLNLAGLNAIQQAFSDEGATQCGFCTPGFIVSLAGFCMSKNVPAYDKAIEAVNGNICRCTGYKSIERAAQRINALMEKREKEDAITFAINMGIIPEYFSTIREKLSTLNAGEKEPVPAGNKFLGGGTDLYVQQHDSMPGEKINFLYGRADLKGIIKKDQTVEMGAATTVTEIADSPVFNEYFPSIKKYIHLVSSTQIRNMATVGGNFTNASPIGDLTVFFLALHARLILNEGNIKREVALKDFYKGYKTLDKTSGEYLEKIIFDLPAKDHLFNFEKVSKRTCLDIAGVNSAMLVSVKNGHVDRAFISAGGIGPIPTFLSKSSAFLVGKEISPEVISELLSIIKSEISPISDARGSATYKSLLLAQLIKAHFTVFFPAMLSQILTVQPV